MLRFWNGFQVEGHTVYQDDENPNKFYVMPRFPTIGRKASGELAIARQ